MIDFPHQIQFKDITMELVIGIDVSKKKLDLSVYDGTKHQAFCIQNSKKGIISFLKSYVSRMEECLFVMEATGVYHLNLVTIIYDMGFKVGVVNPLRIKRFAQMKMIRVKTDSADARIIAEYGFEQPVSLFNPRSKERQKIINLLKGIEAHSKTKDAYYNRLKALLQDPGYEKTVVISYRKIIRSLNREIKKFEQDLKKLVLTHYPETYAQLMKIDSVGFKTAVIIIGYFGRFEDFENSKQVASFIGINPSPKESGSSVRGRGRISKKGNTYIRKQLFMTSLSAMQHNKTCKEIYDRLKSKGKEHKVCRVAVMNKLVKQIFAILKYDRAYDPNYCRNILLN